MQLNKQTYSNVLSYWRFHLNDDQEADTDGSGVLNYSQFKDVSLKPNPTAAGFSTAS